MFHIPLTNQPNQSFTCNIPLLERNITLDFFMYWCSVSGYWVMNIFDPTTKSELIYGMPMLTSAVPAEDLLGQYKHFNIGSAYIIPVNPYNTSNPGLEDWDVNFVLIWDD